MVKPTLESNKPRRGHYIHNVTYTHRERLVGAFVLTAMLAVIGLLAINISATHVFEKKVMFHAYLSDGSGLGTDTTVEIAGIEAGKVAAIDITDDNRIIIDFYIYERFHERLRADAQATLNRLSMLGVASIGLAPGSAGMPVLVEGSVLEMRETLSVEQLMQGMGELLYRADRQDVTSIVSDIGSVAENLKLITASIRAGEGAAGTLIYDKAFNSEMVAALNSLHALLDTTSERIEQTAPLIADADQLIDDLRQTGREIPALLSEIKLATTEARQALGIVSREMQQLPDFMVRADVLLRDASELVDALERIWPISTALEQDHGDGLVIPQAVHD
jgi:phospholipid/cholesterol/gamma-HCH transport system substrate-binding protein